MAELTKEQKVAIIKQVAQEIFSSGEKVRNVVECYDSDRIPIFNSETGELKIVEKSAIEALGKTISDETIKTKQIAEIKKVITWYRQLDDKICGKFEALRDIHSTNLQGSSTDMQYRQFSQAADGAGITNLRGHPFIVTDAV